MTVEDRVLLHTDWAGYLKVLDALGEARGVWMTYDRGELEIRRICAEHARLADTMGVLLRSSMRAAGLDYRAGGDQTLKRKAKGHGFEPDRCY